MRRACRRLRTGQERHQRWPSNAGHRGVDLESGSRGCRDRRPATGEDVRAGQGRSDVSRSRRGDHLEHRGAHCGRTPAEVGQAELVEIETFRNGLQVVLNRHQVPPRPGACTVAHHQRAGWCCIRYRRCSCCSPPRLDPSFANSPRGSWSHRCAAFTKPLRAARARGMPACQQPAFPSGGRALTGRRDC
jgi:hypothetical protein